MNILCWNTDDAVWTHWQKIIGNKASLVRALDLEQVNLKLDANQDTGFQYFFVYLEDEGFSQHVEDLVNLCRNPMDFKVVIFPNQPSQTAAVRLFSSGISGQCAPYIGEEQLWLALSVIDSGEIWGGRAFIQNLIAQSAANPAAPLTDDALFDGLSEREADVVKQVARGLSNKQIALEMAITERTVKSHLTAVFKKTHTKDRLSLALLVQNSSVTH